jgi:TM2 domain-containing membrane protein YozV
MEGRVKSSTPSKTAKEWPPGTSRILKNDVPRKDVPPCGEFFDPIVRQSRTPKAWNPGVAAVLSFVIPGAGQIYKGQIGPGIGWLIRTVAGYCAFVVPGLIRHIVCVYKAYSDDPRKTTVSRQG